MASLASTTSPIEALRAVSAAVGLLVCLSMTWATYCYSRRTTGFERQVQRFRVVVELCGCFGQLFFLCAAVNAALTPGPILAALQQTAATNGLLLLCAQNTVTLAATLANISRRVDREWRDSHGIDPYSGVGRRSQQPR